MSREDYLPADHIESRDVVLDTVMKAIYDLVTTSPKKFDISAIIAGMSGAISQSMYDIMRDEHGAEEATKIIESFSDAGFDMLLAIKEIAKKNQFPGEVIVLSIATSLESLISASIVESISNQNKEESATNATITE